MSDFVVVCEHPDLVLYVDALQRKNAEALSFYPRCVFEREQENRRLFLGLLNGQPCGYLYVGAIGMDVKCHQVCIEYDARRRLYGASLVTVMEQYAMNGGAVSITLRCGFDLDANTFWKSLGYICIAHHLGGARRMRTINVWRKQLQPALFESLELEPAQGKTDASLWRKNKQKGLVTGGMRRGKAMQDYRRIVTNEQS